MYKIFNFNNSSDKKINYNLYRIISVVLPFFLIPIIICMCFNLIVGSCLLALLLLLYVCFTIITHILFKKYFNCSVYVLNEENQEFYKMGIFPRVIKFTPTDEDFLTDNYFANYMFSDVKKYFKLSLLRSLNYPVKEFAKDTVVKYKFREGSTFLYFNTLKKLNDHNYILNQLNNEKFSGKVFKITTIYSYEFNDNDNYYIVCDVIENNKKTEYKKVKLTINKLFDKNDVIKNYIINNCKNAEAEIDETV